MAGAAGAPGESGRIRVGIGGWTFEPWRDGVFYPPKLPHARELSYAAERLSAIEINGTYYSRFKAESFAKWRDETPEDFVFTVKASRFCTNRKVLADAGEGMARFFEQGIVELGPKLGPILWQFMPTKKFDPVDFQDFLKLLPPEHGGVRLRHAVQVRHDSFQDPAFVEMCEAAGVAVVYAHSVDYPALADLTADFAYVRLEAAEAEVETGYTPDALDRWADVAVTLAEARAPAGLPYVTPPANAKAHGPRPGRDVFVFMINGAKERAPAAALGLIERLRAQTSSSS